MKLLKENDHFPRRKSRTSRLAIRTLAAFVFCVAIVQQVSGGVFTSLDFPGSTSTYPLSVSGNNVVGKYYSSDSTDYGFLYDGSSYTTLHPPGAYCSDAIAVSGNEIIGNYSSYSTNPGQHGYVYSDSTYTTIDFPGAFLTNLSDMSDGILLSDLSRNFIVGTYMGTDAISHGFLYDGENYFTIHPPGAVESNTIAISSYGIIGKYRDSNDQWHNYVCSSFWNYYEYITIDFPGADWSRVRDISGHNIVGAYTEAFPYPTHGFLYDGENYTTIDPYWGGSFEFVDVVAISGDKIIGRAEVGDSWLAWVYDGSSYTEFALPGATNTEPEGISGDSIVGTYSLENGERHGFLYQVVPEPSMIVLLSIGSGILSVSALRRCRLRAK